MEERIEQLLGKVNESVEDATVKQLEAKVHPVLYKYNFTGKLDDPEAEDHFNQTLWDRARDRLEQYDEKDLTQALIAKEVKAVYSVLTRVIQKKAEKQTEKIAEDRKRSAQETAAVQQTKSVAGSEARTKLNDHLKKGDLHSILSNWDTFGKMF